MREDYEERNFNLKSIKIKDQVESRDTERVIDEDYDI